MTTLSVMINGKIITVEISSELHEKLRLIANQIRVPLAQLARECWEKYGEISENSLNEYLKGFSSECFEETPLNILRINIIE